MKQFILLIDDRRECLKYYRTALIDGGFEVFQLYDPDAVVEYMSNNQHRSPDLIVLDIMMPPGKRYISKQNVQEGRRTGVLLFEELRQRYSLTPIIILTSMSTSNPASLPPQSSATRICEKVDTPPFDLLDIVRAMLVK